MNWTADGKGGRIHRLPYEPPSQPPAKRAASGRYRRTTDPDEQADAIVQLLEGLEALNNKVDQLWAHVMAHSRSRYGHVEQVDTQADYSSGAAV